MEIHVLDFPIWLFFISLCVYVWFLHIRRSEDNFQECVCVCMCGVYTHMSLRGYGGQRAGFRSLFSFHRGFHRGHSNHQTLLPTQPSHHSAIWFVPIFISR